MRHVPRVLEREILRAMRAFPAVVLTGPRRAGKTWLLRHLLPRATYVLLEDPDVVARVRSDPQGFLDDLALPVILDEAQNVPELFAYVRARIDRRPRRTGQWVLTGSQESPRMRDITESLAGRAATLQLLPLSSIETARVSILRGGYPEVVARPSSAALWFRSYLRAKPSQARQATRSDLARGSESAARGPQRETGGRSARPRPPDPAARAGRDQRRRVLTCT